MGYFSVSCHWSTVAKFGETVLPFVKACHEYIGLPQNIASPFAFAANNLCVNERVAITFGALVGLGVVAGICSVGTVYLSIKGTKDLVTGHPFKAVNAWCGAMNMATAPTAIYIVAQKIL